MTQPSPRWRRGVSALNAAALVFLAFAGAASSARIVAGGLIVVVEGGFKPTGLPAKRNAPIVLWAEGKISTTSGALPPLLREVELEFDRHGSLQTAGLANCTAQQLEATTVSVARGACPAAIVGEGYAQATVSSPHGSLTPVTIPITLFNGPRQNGAPTILAHAYTTVPAPTTFVVPVGLEPIHNGSFGYRTRVAVPEIDGGAAVLVAFHIRVGRRWTYKGRAYSYLNARCEVGFLQSHGKFTFANGFTLSGSLFRSCTVRR